MPLGWEGGFHAVANFSAALRLVKEEDVNRRFVIVQWAANDNRIGTEVIDLFAFWDEFGKLISFVPRKR